MNFSSIYNQLDTQDDFINCDRFLDIEFGMTLEEIDLYGNEDRE